MTYLLGYVSLGICFLLATRAVNYFLRSDGETQDSLAIARKNGRFDFMDDVDDAVFPMLALVFAVACWPVAWWVAREMAAPKRDDTDKSVEEPFAIVRGDLIASTSINEIELRELVDDPLGAAPRMPFGHLHEQWVTFRNEVLPGDSIWSFTADRTDNWGLQRRYRGYVCVRDQEIGPFVVMMTQSLPLAGD